MPRSRSKSAKGSAQRQRAWAKAARARWVAFEKRSEASRRAAFLKREASLAALTHEARDAALLRFQLAESRKRERAANARLATLTRKLDAAERKLERRKDRVTPKRAIERERVAAIEAVTKHYVEVSNQVLRKGRTLADLAPDEKAAVEWIRRLKAADADERRDIYDEIRGIAKDDGVNVRDVYTFWLYMGNLA